MKKSELKAKYENDMAAALNATSEVANVLLNKVAELKYMHELAESLDKQLTAAEEAIEMLEGTILVKNSLIVELELNQKKASKK